MKSIDIEEIYSHWDTVKSGGKSKKTLDAYSAINNILRDVYNDYSPYRDEASKTIEQAIHFYKGNMHLEYDEVVKNYRVRPVTKFNDWIPRPTTNLIQPRVDTIASLFTRRKPQAKVLANSTKREDINKAKFSDWLLDAKWEIDKEFLIALDMIYMALIAGTVYRKDGWNASSIRSLVLEGKKKVPIGDTYVDLFSPLEIICDYNNGNRDMDKGDFVIETGLVSIDKIKRDYNLKEQGYTGLAKNIQKDPDVNYSLNILNRLKTSNDSHTSDIDNENSAVRMEGYIAPIKDYEKGLMIVSAGSEIVYIDECKYTNQDGTNWHPYTDFQWIKDPFSHLGQGLVEQLISLNERYNAIDALIILNRRLNVAPQWIYKIGSMMANQKFNGAPGAAYGYKGDIPPQRMAGMPLDVSVWKEKEDIKLRMTEISGDNEVLSGQRPEGVTTASQMNMLLEQSYGKFNPKTGRWETIWERCQGKKLNNMRKFYKEVREDVAQRIQASNPKVPRTVIEDFFTDDGLAIGDNLQVRVETGSSLPRSDAVIQETYKEMAKGGMFGSLDPMMNPIGNKEFLRKMNIDKFPNQTNPQVERALWENDAMRQGRNDEVEVFPTDSPTLHYQVHVNEILEEEFFENNEVEVIMEFIQHTLKHYVMLSPPEKQSLQINPSMDFQLMTMAQGMGIVDPLQAMQAQQAAMMQQMQPPLGPGLPSPQPGPVLGQPMPQPSNMPANVGMPSNPSIGGM